MVRKRHKIKKWCIAHDRLCGLLALNGIIIVILSIGYNYV